MGGGWLPGPRSDRIRYRAPAGRGRGWTGKVGQRPGNASAGDQHALRWEVLPELPAATIDLRQEAVEVAHGAGWHIMQHHERPRLDGDLGQCGINPSVRILPIARHRVPQYATIAACLQQCRGLNAE